MASRHLPSAKPRRAGCAPIAASRALAERQALRPACQFIKPDYPALEGAGAWPRA
jgi:hypothetical protein